MEVRNKSRKPLVEPSSASIPRGQSFAFRLANAEDFADYTIHWVFNGQRIPGAHKPEISFFHMRPRFDGEYKVILTRGGEILASAPVSLHTSPAGSQTVTSLEPISAAENEFLVFDPLDPANETEEPAAVAPVVAEELPAAEEAVAVEEAVPAPISLPEKKKKAFLEKALKKTKKAS